MSIELRTAIESYVSSIVLLSDRRLVVNQQTLHYLSTRVYSAFNSELYRAEVDLHLSTNEYNSVIIKLTEKGEAQ
jgi:hypothetical protein